jgi:proteic killer suppression protein
MIQSFRGRGTEDIFEGHNSKEARKTCPQGLWPVARRKLDQLDSAERLQDIALHVGNKLEALAGDRAGQYSIRVNEQYRICFVWAPTGPASVEIIDYQ